MRQTHKETNKVLDEIWQTREQKHKEQSLLALRRYQKTGHEFFKKEADYHNKVSLLAKECLP